MHDSIEKFEVVKIDNKSHYWFTPHPSVVIKGFKLLSISSDFDAFIDVPNDMFYQMVHLIPFLGVLEGACFSLLFSS